MAPMSANLDLIKSFYAAVSQGDVPTVLGALDPAIQWREADNFLYARDTPYVGPEEVLTNVFVPIATQWNMSVTVDQFIDAGDTIVALGHYRGTYKANGAKVDAQLVHVLQIANGKIVRFQQYTDTYQFKQAVAA